MIFGRFIRDSAIYGGTAALARGLPILLLPFYTRVFTPHEYGIVDLLTVLAVFVNLTLALEISQGVGRFYAEARDLDDRVAYASTALWFTLAVYTAFAVAAYAAAEPLGKAILGTAERGVVHAAVLSMWVGGVFYLSQNQLRWRLDPWRFAGTTLTYACVASAVTITSIEEFSAGVRGVFYGQLAGAAAGALVGLLQAREDYAFRLDLAKLREMLAYSLPLVPSSVGVFIAYYVDRFAIRKLMTLSDVGVYAAGYRVASIVGLVTVAAQGALTPLILTHYARPETPRELARIFRYFLVLALGILLIASMFARLLLTAFTTRQFYAADRLIPLLVSAIVLSNLYIFAPGLFIAKQTRRFATVNIASAAANTALCLALIPFIGLLGAALATLTTALGSFVATMVLSQKLYPVPHRWPTLVSTVGLAILAVSIDRVVFSNRGTLTFSLVLAKAMLVLVPLSFAIWRLIGWREVLAILMKRDLAAEKADQHSATTPGAEAGGAQ